ncbi:MAG: alpha/beta fold hydrolase [Candidatus Binataceae bacterium]
MSFWVDLLDCQTYLIHGRYRTRVIEGGEGFPLLLLHGAGGHAENRARNLPFFAKHYRAIAMDFLWHGKSQTEGFNEEVLPPLVDQVRDVLDALKLPRVHLGGQSLGGWVAMLFALKYPERVEKLILTTATGYVPDEGSVPGFRAPRVNPDLKPSLTFLDDPSEANIRERLQRVVFDPAVITDEMVAVRQAIYRDPALNRVQREFLRNYPNGPGPARHWITDAIGSRIVQPTLVYWGDKNQPGPEVGKRLASVIPHAKFHSEPLTGHWAQYENHEQYNRIALEFLS